MIFFKLVLVFLKDFILIFNSVSFIRLARQLDSRIVMLSNTLLDTVTNKVEGLGKKTQLITTKVKACGTIH